MNWFNKNEVKIYYKNLERLLTKNNFSSNRIFNSYKTELFKIPAKFLYNKVCTKQVGCATEKEARMLL